MYEKKFALTAREVVLVLGCVGVCMGSDAIEDAELKALYAKLMENRQGMLGGASVTFWRAPDPTTRNMGEPGEAGENTY